MAEPNGKGAYPLSVVLGEHTYEVFPQRHAYLTHRLDKWMQTLGDMDVSSAEGVAGLSGFLSVLGDRSYELLSVLIPDLMPEYEFMGFPTEEAFHAGDYSAEYDKSPTFPEVLGAFETCLTINKLDHLKKVTGLVDPRVIRAWVTSQIGTYLTRQASASSSADDTAGLPTTSSTEPQTSAASTD